MAEASKKFQQNRPFLMGRGFGAGKGRVGRSGGTEQGRGRPGRGRSRGRASAGTDLGRVLRYGRDVRVHLRFFRECTLAAKRECTLDCAPRPRPLPVQLWFLASPCLQGLVGSCRIERLADARRAAEG